MRFRRDLRDLRRAAAALVLQAIPDEDAIPALAQRVDDLVTWRWVGNAAALAGPLGALAGKLLAALLESIDDDAAERLARRALRWARRQAKEPPSPGVSRALAIIDALDLDGDGP